MHFLEALFRKNSAKTPLDFLGKSLQKPLWKFLAFCSPF